MGLNNYDNNITGKRRQLTMPIRNLSQRSFNVRAAGAGCRLLGRAKEVAVKIKPHKTTMDSPKT